MAVDRLEAFLKVLTAVCEWELTPQEHKALVERFAELSSLLATVRRGFPSVEFCARRRNGQVGISPRQRFSSARKSLRGAELTSVRRTWQSVVS